MTTKVGTRTYPPGVSVAETRKPTYAELEAEVARLRGKLEQTVKNSVKQAVELKKHIKYQGDQIEWLKKQQQPK